MISIYTLILQRVSFTNDFLFESIFREIHKLQALAFLDIFGVLSDQALTILGNCAPHLGINKFKNSAVARPTVGSRRTSIWGLRTRD